MFSCYEEKETILGVNTDSCRQKIAHCLMWVHSARIWFLSAAAILIEVSSILVLSTSLTWTLPHIVTAFLNTQSHSNTSLKKKFILLCQQRRLGFYWTQPLCSCFNARGVSWLSYGHCPLPTKPVLTSKTFFPQFLISSFMLMYTVTSQKKRWVWNMQ